jgi:hypothetical protein
VPVSSTLEAAMEVRWTVFVKQRQGGTACEPMAVGTFKRRIDGETLADFGLLLLPLRQQSAVHAYRDLRRRQ